MKIRVWVTDVWDNFDLTVSPDDTIADVKSQGLSIASRADVDPAAYAVKYRGALIADEAKPLSTLEAPEGAPMIILPAHRRPVI